MTEFDWDNAPTICELNGYRWVLGRQAVDKMNWADAIEWCKESGGVLPPLEILLIAYLTQDVWFNASYWSSWEGKGGVAWYQDFYEGTQGAFGKSSAFEVRAVKAIKLRGNDEIT